MEHAMQLGTLDYIGIWSDIAILNLSRVKSAHETVKGGGSR